MDVSETLRSGSKGPKIILQMEGDTKRTALLFISIVSVGLCGYFVFLCDHFESPRGYFKFLGVFLNSSWYSREALWSFCVSFWLFLSVHDPFESLPGCFVFLCCTECV